MIVDRFSFPADSYNHEHEMIWCKCTEKTEVFFWTKYILEISYEKPFYLDLGLSDIYVWQVVLMESATKIVTNYKGIKRISFPESSR